MEVAFIGVCLLAGLRKKTTQPIFTKFDGKAAHGQRKRVLYFGGNPDHVTLRSGLGWSWDCGWVEHPMGIRMGRIRFDLDGPNLAWQRKWGGSCFQGVSRGGPQGPQNFRDPTYANRFDLERPNLTW